MRKSNIIEKIDRAQLEDLYCNKLLSIENIGKQLGICGESVKRAISYYNLTRDSSKVKSNSLVNSIQRHIKFEEVKNRISKEDLYNYYIIENHSWEESPSYFNITSSMFDKLCNYYGVKKDKSKIYKNCLNLKYKEYGSREDYYKQLIEKAQETRITNSGSLEESYKLGFEKIRKTNFEKYGVECILNSPQLQDLSHKKFTLPNNQFAELLERENISYMREFSLELKSYDFKVGNNLIEINPTITHNSNWSPYGTHQGIDKNYHLEKSNISKSHNYRCIHIWDWDDKEKIVNSLKNKTPIQARKCLLKEVSKQELSLFLNKYHFQSNCKGQSIKLGLYYQNELVQIMTFGKPRYNKNYEWELIRLCTKNNYIILGGADKLFKYFLNNYAPKSIISYCDNSKFNGDIYSKLGFKLKSKGVPTAHWYNEKLKIHITDTLLRKQGFDRLLGNIFGVYGKGTSNENLMKSHGFFEVYDCGQSAFEYINN